MRYLAIILRVFLGSVFIFSGVSKLVDPIGFSYKLEEYFSSPVLNLPFLEKFSLVLSILISFYESLLGLFLLLGLCKKILIPNLIVAILFFLVFTFYSAYFDKVKDCGCFGDLWVLSPWESFVKNLGLFAFILLFMFLNRYDQKAFLVTKFKLYFLFAGLGIFIFVPFYGIRYLPMVDFSPFALGKNIREQSKSAQELILKPDEHQIFYTLKNKHTHEEKVLSDKQYISQEIWKDQNWVIQANKTFEKKINTGYTPVLTDFSIEKDQKDSTLEVLESNSILLIICYDSLNPSEEPMLKLKDWLDKNDKIYKIPTLGLSAFTPPIEVPFLDWAFSDAKTLKTMIRSNPGFILLKKGTIAGKWHWKDVDKIRPDTL